MAGIIIGLILQCDLLMHTYSCLSLVSLSRTLNCEDSTNKTHSKTEASLSELSNTSVLDMSKCSIPLSIQRG